MECHAITGVVFHLIVNLKIKEKRANKQTKIKKNQIYKI